MFNSSANTFAVLANDEGMSSERDITITGEDAEEVEIENFGFVALNGDTKVKLFPDTFPESSIPISSASLFTIANKRGVFAAAGPSTFILGTTESLRKTFTTAPAGAAHVNYSATAPIPLPTPVSHIAFSSSENYLILGASSGGVAVYSTENLLSGTQTSLFVVGTNGLALRELRPNPYPGSSELIAVMTQNGELRMLNLEMKGFVSGSQGEVLKTGISTIAWSQRGKQLICGLTNGWCSQITPDGVERAAIPKPPGLVDHYVSHVTWLENNLFIVIFTPIPSNPQEPNNDSICYVFSRSSNNQGFRFQKLPDPTPPFGMTARQAYFFCAEIKHWSPRLQDALILANPSSADIGLVTRFSAALPNIPEGTFTVTTIANDSRRAALPLQEQDMTDTSPIGVALDLSSRDRVARPIAGEEPEETGPLPILMVLNNESVVSAWHIVYSDAVRNNETYPQLMLVTEQAPASQPAQQTQAPAVSAFAAPASPFTALSGDNKAFGASKTTTGGSAPAFGQPAFGASSFGQPAASSTRPAFGRPAFGQASFGQSGWGAAPAATAPVTSTFGSSGNTSTTEGSTFGSTSGFGKFATAGGFASMAASAAAGSGPAWAKGIGSGTTSTSAFGGPGTSSFGGLGSTSDNKSAFGSLANTGSGSAFGSSFGPLKVGSTFQADKSSSISAPSDNKDSLFGGFGSSLGGALGNDSTPTAPDTDMDSESPMIATPVDKEEDMESTHSEPSTPTVSSAAASGSSGIFGSSKPVSAFAPPPKSDVPPQAAFPPSPKLAKATPPTDAPLPPDPVPGTGKEEFPDIPLPPMPDDTKDKSKVGDNAAKGASKSAFGLGGSSSSGLFGTTSDKSSFATAGAFGKPVEGSAFGQSTVAPAFKTTGAFGCTVKPPTSGLFSKSPSPSPAPSEKSGMTSSSSATPTPGIFGGKSNVPDSTPRSVFGARTQPLPPLGGEGSGLFGAPAASKKKSSKNGGSVLDTPPDDLSDGIFAGFGKNKPVKSDEEDDEDEKPSKASSSQAKSTLSKKSELGKKPDGTRGKPLSANPMHRFGPGKSRQPLKPSPLSRKQQDEDEEGKVNEEEYEDEEGGGEVEDEEYEEVDTPEEAKKEEVKPKLAFGDKKSQVKPSTPPQPFGAQKPAAFPKPATPPISHRAVTPTPPQRTLTSAPQISRAPTPAAPQEYEDERIWKILQSDIPVEPSPAPPVFVLNDKIVEASPHDEFEAIYDKAYESCNVMVNSIGILSRNLDAYVSAHKQSPDLHKHSQHRPVEQLKEVDEWRLSELGFVAAMIEQAGQVIKDAAKKWEGLDEMIADLTKGILRLQSKASELERLERVIEDPKGAAVAQSHYLPPEQALQQREIRNKLATVQYELEEAEKAVSMLKANVVARDRGKSGGRVKPPTVEAVRNTILKLTAMVETKNSDVEYLGELLRRLKAKQALGGTSINEESTFLRTTLVVGTPARGKGKDKVGGEVTITEETQTQTTTRKSKQEFHPDELEIEETREEIIARRETGRKLRKALKIVGTRVTNVV